jgi:hypothetical protein
MSSKFIADSSPIGIDVRKHAHPCAGCDVLLREELESAGEDMSEGNVVGPNAKRLQEQREAADRILAKLGVNPEMREKLLADPKRMWEEAGIQEDFKPFQPTADVEHVDISYVKVIEPMCSYTCFFGNWFTTESSSTADCCFFSTP